MSRQPCGAQPGGQIARTATVTTTVTTATSATIRTPPRLQATAPACPACRRLALLIRRRPDRRGALLFDHLDALYALTGEAPTTVSKTNRRGRRHGRMRSRPYLPVPWRRAPGRRPWSGGARSHPSGPSPPSPRGPRRRLPSPRRWGSVGSVTVPRRHVAPWQSRASSFHAGSEPLPSSARMRAQSRTHSSQIHTRRPATRRT